MRIPIIHGVIDRRILVNYRVDPDVLAPLLPAPFRPKRIRDHAMVGLCLIRLKHIRPKYLPWWLGIASENAAHRAAVEWDEGGITREGVFVWRRDTNSRLNTLAGGRLFPGIHHHARFDVTENANTFSVALVSDDGRTRLAVHAWQVPSLTRDSAFTSIEEASAYFEAGSLGYSTTPHGDRFQGLELRCKSWHVEPLAVSAAQSSFFDNETRFPRGSIALDGALLMRGIEHEWHGCEDLCCPNSADALSAQSTVIS